MCFYCGGPTCRISLYTHQYSDLTVCKVYQVSMRAMAHPKKIVNVRVNQVLFLKYCRGIAGFFWDTGTKPELSTNSVSSRTELNSPQNSSFKCTQKGICLGKGAFLSFFVKNSALKNKTNFYETHSLDAVCGNWVVAKLLAG